MSDAGPITNDTLSTVLLRAVRSGVGAVEVALEAEVQSYDRATCLASVVVCVDTWRDMPDGERQWATMPKLDRIPVAWPAVAGCSFTLGDLAVGDRVQMVIRSRSHAEVRAGSPIPARPASSSRWSLLDAWINPSPAAALPAGSTAADGPVLRMAAGRKFRAGSATANKALALAQKVEAELAKIQTAHNTHVHVLTLSVGTGTAAAPVITYTPGTVDSARIFTDDT